MRAEHGTAVAGASAVAYAIVTNAPTGDQACAIATADINVMRGGVTNTVIPPMTTTAGAATIAGDDAVKLADAKKEKSPADPLNIVVINLDYNKVLWGVYNTHIGLMRKVVEYCRAKNLLPSIPYDAEVKSCLSYHIKGM